MSHIEQAAAEGPAITLGDLRKLVDRSNRLGLEDDAEIGVVTNLAFKEFANFRRIRVTYEKEPDSPW